MVNDTEIIQSNKAEKLSEDIINYSRNTLVINFRFMDKSLSLLHPANTSLIDSISVDGKNIYYNKSFILKSFIENKKLTVRQYLHMTFHCVFQHFWVSTLVNKDLWNLACDIAVENMINELDEECVLIGIEQKQQEKIDELKNKIKYITADHIYSYLLNNKLSKNKIAELTELFKQDNHDLWYLRSKQKVLLNGGVPSQNSTSNEGNNNSKQNKKSSQSDVSSNENSNSQTNNINELLNEWKNAAEKMKMDMESFSKERGDKAANLTQNLKELTREKYDYREFLKKFAVMSEKMKVNDDEFDYIFYTYGLKVYENMPLIEPLEYKDSKQIKDFVIAIDTSGSTSGDLVQTFLNKTYNILKEQESFNRRFNLHIIQCDADIQEDIKITNQEEFDKYIKKMKIKGLGGTDFRPVFDYVEELREKHEFNNLKGLIYFTDGCGVFPKKEPDYHIAFVYIDDEFNNYEVPVWAIKLILKSEEIGEI